MGYSPYDSTIESIRTNLTKLKPVLEELGAEDLVNIVRQSESLPKAGLTDKQASLLLDMGKRVYDHLVASYDVSEAWLDSESDKFMDSVNYLEAVYQIKTGVNNV